MSTRVSQAWVDRIAALPPWLATSVEAGVGLREREDTALPRTGGPAGNARLTAWTGMVLFVVLAAEGITLIDVRGLISWHVGIGAVLLPLAGLKIATTGWRMVRYYGGAAAYKAAGPPPVLLRVLAPLVVLATVAVLGTGVVLVLIGEERSREHVLSLAGFGADWIWLHQASFVVWLVVTTVHVLGRLVPGLVVVRRSVAVPAVAARVVALLAAAALGAVCAVLLVHADASWTVHELDRLRR